VLPRLFENLWVKTFGKIPCCKFPPAAFLNLSKQMIKHANVRLPSSPTSLIYYSQSPLQFDLQNWISVHNWTYKNNSGRMKEIISDMGLQCEHVKRTISNHKSLPVFVYVVLINLNFKYFSLFSFHMLILPGLSPCTMPTNQLRVYAFS